MAWNLHTVSSSFWREHNLSGFWVQSHRAGLHNNTLCLLHGGYLWEESRTDFADNGLLYLSEPSFTVGFFFVVVALCVYVNIGHSSFIFVQFFW